MQRITIQFVGDKRYSSSKEQIKKMTAADALRCRKRIGSSGSRSSVFAIDVPAVRYQLRAKQPVAVSSPVANPNSVHATG
ncbi:hypothetical protein J6590_035506 [Homalodisca vitripennis]|nr:hypothetical protein J6590_035506 [Homalodisca vitripennis]